MTTNTAKQVSDNAQKVLDGLRDIITAIALENIHYTSHAEKARITANEAIALIELMAKGEAVDSREAFERNMKASPYEWESSRFKVFRDDSAWEGSYSDYQTKVAWDVWQDARRSYTTTQQCACQAALAKGEGK